MSILTKIKADQLLARKLRNIATASLLTTVIGESEMVGKNAGNREPTDAEVIGVLRKFEKNLKENLVIYDARHISAKATDTVFELLILEKYLPSKLTNSTIREDIRSVINEKNLPFEQKSMGTVVAVLKEKYGDQFDGRQVSSQFKECLVGEPK